MSFLTATLDTLLELCGLCPGLGAPCVTGGSSGFPVYPGWETPHWEPTWLSPDLSQGQVRSWVKDDISLTLPCPRPPSGAADRSPGLQRHQGERGPSD